MSGQTILLARPSGITVVRSKSCELFVSSLKFNEDLQIQKIFRDIIESIPLRTNPFFPNLFFILEEEERLRTVFLPTPAILISSGHLCVFPEFYLPEDLLSRIIKQNRSKTSTRTTWTKRIATLIITLIVTARFWPTNRCLNCRVAF
ncbi:hypothetical protein CEXT_246631 [Caerostris extrusa]|uniref:Uncharacterized protein n=1 Tax=Caerostris extrusa TaxID=172846 RepID=A0AAV4NTN1_CAEEX|nr:hypothetical protein CEXT_246631 [Caerostris extrusa]